MLAGDPDWAESGTPLEMYHHASSPHTSHDAETSSSAMSTNNSISSSNVSTSPTSLSASTFATTTVASSLDGSSALSISTSTSGSGEQQQWTEATAIAPASPFNSSQPSKMAKVIGLLSTRLRPENLFDLVRGVVSEPECNVNETTPDGASALHWACYAGDYAVTELLLDCRADPNLRNQVGQTPLHWASMNGRVPAIRMVLLAGANPLLQCQAGYTALHYAARYGHSFAVDYLWASGAPLDAVDAEGRTPLHLAVEHDQSLSAKVLIERGASLGATDIYGATPIHLGAAAGHDELVRSLVRFYGGYRFLHAKASLPAFRNVPGNENGYCPHEVAQLAQRNKLSRFLRSRTEKDFKTNLELIMCRDDAGKDASMWWIGRWLVAWLIIWQLHFLFVVRPEGNISTIETVVFHILATVAVITWIVCHLSDPGYILPAPPPAFSVSPWELLANLNRMRAAASGEPKANDGANPEEVVGAITGESGNPAGDDAIPPSITLLSHSTHGLALAHKHIRDYEAAQVHAIGTLPRAHAEKLSNLRSLLAYAVSRAQLFRLVLLRSLPSRPALSLGVAIRKAMGWWTVDQQRALAVRLRRDAKLAVEAVANFAALSKESNIDVEGKLTDKQGSILGDSDSDFDLDDDDDDARSTWSTRRWKRQRRAAVSAALAAAAADTDFASWVSKYIAFIDPLNGKFAQPHLYGNLLRLAALERKHVAVKVVALSAAHQQRLEAERRQSGGDSKDEAESQPQPEAIEMSVLHHALDEGTDERANICPLGNSADADEGTSARRRTSNSGPNTLTPNPQTLPNSDDEREHERERRAVLGGVQHSDDIRIQMDSTEHFGRPIISATRPTTQSNGDSSVAGSGHTLAPRRDHSNNARASTPIATDFDAKGTNEVNEWMQAMQVMAPFDLDVEARISAAKWRCRHAARQLGQSKNVVQDVAPVMTTHSDGQEVSIDLSESKETRTRDVTGQELETRLGFDATRGIFAGPLALLKIVDHMATLNAKAHDLSLEYDPPDVSASAIEDDFNDVGSIRERIRAPRFVSRMTMTRPYLTFAQIEAIAQEFKTPTKSTSSKLFAPVFAPPPSSQLPSVLSTDAALDSEEVPHGGEFLGCDFTPVCDGHCLEPVPGKGGCCNFSCCAGEEVQAFDEAGACAGCLGTARIQAREATRVVLDTLVRERQAIVAVVKRSHKYAANMAARMRERMLSSPLEQHAGFQSHASRHDGQSTAEEGDMKRLLIQAEDRERAAAEVAALTVESTLRNTLLPLGYGITPLSTARSQSVQIQQHPVSSPLASTSPPPLQLVMHPVGVASHMEHRFRGGLDCRGSQYLLPRLFCRALSTLCCTLPRQCGTRPFAYAGIGIAPDIPFDAMEEVARQANGACSCSASPSGGVGVCGSLCSALDCSQSSGSAASHAQIKPTNTKVPPTVCEFEFAGASVAAIATRAIEVEADEVEGGFGTTGHEESDVIMVSKKGKTSSHAHKPRHASSTEQMQREDSFSLDSISDWYGNGPHGSSMLGSSAHHAASAEAHRHCSEPDCSGCYICEPSLPHPPNAALAGLRYHAMVALGAGSAHTLCSVCRVAKPFRSMHCKRCNRCVYRMDHHCPWMDNCIGANNYRSFMLFITLGSVLSLWYTTRTFGAISFETFTTSGLVSLFFGFHAALMALFVIMLWCSHMYLVSINMSTQEHISSESLASRRAANSAIRETSGGSRFDYGFINNWRQFFRGYAREPLYFPNEHIPVAVQEAALREVENNSNLTAALGAAIPVDIVVPERGMRSTAMERRSGQGSPLSESPDVQAQATRQVSASKSRAVHERAARFADSLLATIKTSNDALNATAAATVNAAIRQVTKARSGHFDVDDDDDDDDNDEINATKVTQRAD